MTGVSRWWKAGKAYLYNVGCRRQAINIGDLNLRFDNEVVILGNDLKERVARPHDSANRINPRIDILNLSIPRRLDLDATENVLRDVKSSRSS